MQTAKITHDRYPKSRKHFILNLAISLWFDKEKEHVKKVGTKKRIALWEKMNPFNMLVEPPVIFTNNTFLACLVDRPAGVLLPDREVPLLSFQQFLDESLLSDNVDPDSSDINQALADKIKNGTIAFEDLYEIIYQPDELSTEPVFYLTKIDGQDDFVVIYDNKEQEPDFDKMISWVFRDYDFEEITMEVYEPDDEETKQLNPSIEDVSTFYTGTVSVSDKALKEKTLTFKFIDLKLLSDVVKSLNKVIIIDVQNKEISQITDIYNQSQTIGSDTAVLTSEDTKPDQIILYSAVTDNGVDITSTSELVVTKQKEAQFNAELKLSEFPYAFCFLNDKGYRRYVSASIKTKSSEDMANEVVYPVNYDLSENYYRPTVMSLFKTDRTDQNTPIYTLGLKLDKNDPVIPHTLGERFKLLTEKSDAIFIGPDVTVKDGVFYFDIILSKYGNVNLFFTDNAVADVVITDVISPNASISWGTSTIKYLNGVLEATYRTDGRNMSNLYLDKLKFIDKENLKINGVEPTVTLGSNSSAGRWMRLSWKVDDVNIKQHIYGNVTTGNGGVLFPFEDTINFTGANGRLIRDINFTIDDIELTDLTPIPVTIGKDSVITANTNLNSGSAWKLGYTDGSGDGSSRAYISVTFSKIEETNNQFSMSAVIQNTWPISFNNDVSSGVLEIYIQSSGLNPEVDYASANYRLKWPKESISPKVSNLVKTDTGYTVSLRFYDANGKVFTNASKQNFSDDFKMFNTEAEGSVTYQNNSLNLKRYIGSSSTPTEGTVDIYPPEYGNSNIVFTEDIFKPAVLSILDPKAKYSFNRLDAKVGTDGYVYLRYELYKDGEKYSVAGGYYILKGDDLAGGLGVRNPRVKVYQWDYDGYDASLMTVRFENTNNLTNPSYNLSGKVYVGDSKQEVFINDSGTITD